MSVVDIVGREEKTRWSVSAIHDYFISSEVRDERSSEPLILS